MSGDSASAVRFASESGRYLTEVHLARIERALDALDKGDLFWRPAPDALSFGTILLHLEGNVRQWVLSGIGGIQDERDRDGEFAAASGPSDDPEESARVLFGKLHDTVHEAARLIERLDEAQLVREGTFQGRRLHTLAAIYHVVEHFAYHTGQAVWIAKARA